MDIDIFLKDINELLLGVLTITSSKNVSGNPPSTSLINIRMSMTTTPLDESFSSEVPKTKVYPRRERNDPLIDVIDTGSQIRIITTLPGIRSEDVWFDIENGILTIEISKYGQVLRKEIPCNISSEQISIKSSTVKNSVLEIIFDKV